MSTKAKKSAKAVDNNGEIPWPFTKINYILFGISILVMVIGFFLMGQGDTTFSVVLIVIAYCVLVPIAILKRDKTEDTAQAEPEE